MTLILGVDLESYSDVSLKTRGVTVYAQSPGTGLHCAVFIQVDTKDFSEVRSFRWKPGLDLPSWVVEHVESGLPVVAHNVAFEASMIRFCRSCADWPFPRLDQWIDTMQLANLFGVPANLEWMAKMLHVSTQKDMEGAAVMKGILNRPATPEETERLLDYCEADVRAMLECYSKFPKPTPFEQQLMVVDRKINARGVFIDATLVARIGEAVEVEKTHLSRAVLKATGGDMVDAGSPAALKALLVENGVEIPTVVKVDRTTREVTKKQTLGKSVLPSLIDSELTPAHVASVLKSRLHSSRLTSLGKAQTMRKQSDRAGRARWMLHYHGAHTGRWSSKGIQLHNLPKTGKDYEDIYDELHGAVRGGGFTDARVLAPNFTEGLSMLLRSLIAAPPGRELIGADYSAIEARVIAWLAGELKVLDIFASGRDIYMEDAKASGSDNRQFGKVQRLALAYGMGGLTFFDTAAAWGVLISRREATLGQLAWRKNNPNIVNFWHELQEAFLAAMQTGLVQQVGKLRIGRTRRGVEIELPSRRRLVYQKAHTKPVIRKLTRYDLNLDKVVSEEIEMIETRFWRPKGKTMVQDTTYGGKLAENVTQAVARDLLAEALVRLDATPYDVVMHVHDSIVAEVPLGAGSVDEFCGLLTQLPPWAAGLPMAVEGYRSPYFRG